MNNPERIGHITSSKIHLICQTSSRDKKSPITNNKWSSGALTYFEEKRIEKRLGRCLDTGGYNRAAAWGNFMEMIVFNHLGLNYDITSNETTEHPDQEFKDYWAGSQDLIVPGVKIGEIKCYQLKKFAQYTDALTLPITDEFTIEDKIQNLKNNFAQEYWQLISNGIINQVNKVEAISFAPYESEMPEIREIASNYDDIGEQWKYGFIVSEAIENLAVLKDDGYYNNLNMFEFEIPPKDKEYLISRMKLAKQELIINT